MDLKLIFTACAFVALCTVSIAYDKEKCDAPPTKRGVCTARFRRWVFKDKKCERISFGGCFPTENYFRSLEECEASCIDLIVNRMG